MGSKSAAKTLMEKSGVPLLPGYHGDRSGRCVPRRSGEPHWLPADDQGGVRRRRPRHADRVAADEFTAALDPARQEAASAFGDDHVLLERYLTTRATSKCRCSPTRQGNVVHLFERDCSIQRRHQKVIEEAPAPGLDDNRRAAMGHAAVAAARAVGYEGAGTVEFVGECGRVLFPRNEHPSAGRASGYRNDHRLRPRRMAIARRGGRASAGRAGCDPHQWPCDRGAYIRRGSGARVRAVDLDDWRCSARRSRRQTSASIPDLLPATRVRPL